MTGQGIKSFFDAVEEARQEYEACVPVFHFPKSAPFRCDHDLTLSRDYKPELDRRAEERKERTDADKKAQLHR